MSRETQDGPLDWKLEVFDDPQADATRRKVMYLIGREIEAAMGENLRTNPTNPDPVHVVVPHSATADLLASTADQLQSDDQAVAIAGSTQSEIAAALGIGQPAVSQQLKAALSVTAVHPEAF